MISEVAVGLVAPYLITPDVLSGENQDPEVIEPTYQEIVVHNGYDSNSAIQNYVNYAYNLGGMDFVKLIECENGIRDPNRVSKTHDHGLCQLNYVYNKNFINSSDFSNPYRQLDYCYEKFKVNPKLWYGPDRKIRGKKCTDYVDDRFDIILI